MRISLINCTSKPDAEVLQVVDAINHQLEHHFEPYWHWKARVRLEGVSPMEPGRSLERLKQEPQDLRGDAIIYLWEHVADVEGALGYHDQNNRGLPYGFVFTDLATKLDGHWSVTLSHEVLELVGDANANTFAAGPHPADPDRVVLHWYEMCDAVQAESYAIHDVRVSNFVLPLYFTTGEQTGARNDYLGTVRNGKMLHSFGVNPGGYVGFFDPVTGAPDTYSGPDDEIAARRFSLKSGMGRTRRAPLYQGLAAPRTRKARLSARSNVVKALVASMSVPYPADKKYVLWVGDTPPVEGFTLFIDGVNAGGHFAETTQLDIERPSAPMTIRVEFGGQNGGEAAIVDVTSPGARKIVTANSLSLSHQFTVTP